MRLVGPPPIVYLGPSLSLATASGILGADYRPPVKRGDLPVRYDGTIVIIDGDFHQRLSVSPKEILRLLDAGTRVVGAASMGALRAVELARYGMEGCGWVFEAYRSGRLEADDEVAVSYSPEDMRCLTVPLVNVRRWLDELIVGGDIDERTAGWLFERARELFYADRTPKRLWAAWSRVIARCEMERLLAVTGGQITDVKAADVMVALKTLAVNHRKTSNRRDGHARRFTAER
jgi:hypothetical protein